MDFDNKLIKKPWGEEYQLYADSRIAIWHLLIKQGFETSFHAHPNKKTGLIIIEGGAIVSFMNDSFKIMPPDKVMIRQGVFHKTKAVVGDIRLLEVESPNNKNDLVRLEDKYGRAWTPYETGFEPLEHSISINGFTTTQCMSNQIEITNQNIDSLDFVNYLIIDGTIHKDDFIVCSPGDIVNTKTLKTMFEKFDNQQWSLKVVGFKYFSN